MTKDDPAVPEETVIYYSKITGLVLMVVGGILIATGIVLLLVTANFQLILLLPAGAYLGYHGFWFAPNAEPQIILNNKGLQTVGIPFYEWKEISFERVMAAHEGRNAHYFLKYTCPEGSVQLETTRYTINKEDLEWLLKVYHSRYERELIVK